ncbi:MAG: hypothetical protein QM773_04530 [Hyphomonadaceae bacterium]
MSHTNSGWTARLVVLLMVSIHNQAFAQGDGEADRPPPAEMYAQYEFSIPAAHFEMREYPPASKAITGVGARISADVEIAAVNRDKQFSSTVGFWVFDETYNKGIRLMLADEDGAIGGQIDMMIGHSSVGLSEFNPHLSTNGEITVVITRPSDLEIGYTIAGKVRKFKVPFTPAHVVFQAVGVDGFVEFTEPLPE